MESNSSLHRERLICTSYVIITTFRWERFRTNEKGTTDENENLKERKESGGKEREREREKGEY